MEFIDWVSVAQYLAYGSLSGFFLGALLGGITLWVTSFFDVFNQL